MGKLGIWLPCGIYCRVVWQVLPSSPFKTEGLISYHYKCCQLPVLSWKTLLSPSENFPTKTVPSFWGAMRQRLISMKIHRTNSLLEYRIMLKGYLCFRILLGVSLRLITAQLLLSPTLFPSLFLPSIGMTPMSTPLLISASYSPFQNLFPGKSNLFLFVFMSWFRAPDINIFMNFSLDRLDSSKKNFLILSW
jgi:hypothetical protein